MAQLAVRNFTIHPIQLTGVERVEAERTRHAGILGAILGAIKGLFRTRRHRHEAVGSDDVRVTAEPFRTTQTAIRAPAGRSRRLLRLTLTTKGHGYESHVPGSSMRSAVMRKLDDGPHDLTVVHVPAGALIAVFASAALNAWMRELHDDWPLTLLSIPGTHNSPTCHRALPSVRCQAVGVPDQLRHGVRFLDIRVSANPDNDVLALVHGAFPISLARSRHFGPMLDHVYRFLDENHSETILMSIKREGTGKGSDGQLAKCLQRSYVDKKPDRWWTEPSIPTLGQARGRIVLIRRFALDDDMRQSCWDGRGWAIDAQQWPDNCEHGTGGDGHFCIQDFYDIATRRNIVKKIQYSHEQLERAAEQIFALAGMPDHQPDAQTPPFFVNFLTASNFFNASCWPENIAAKVNPAVTEYLCINHGEEGKGPKNLKVGSAGTGIVVSDWVGANGNWDLVRCIVGMNARLQHKE